MMEFSVLGIDRHRMKTDGKGITSLVALAGCPLSCPYCINAEVLQNEKRIEKLTPQMLVERLAIDHCYFLYTGGGVTFGGGEPLLHSEQLVEFAKVCPEEWNITIETSLNLPFERLEPLLTGRFSFIIDIKAMQPEIYAKYTGKENRQVICNVKRLRERLLPEKYVVKVPLIPDYSEKEDVEKSCEELQKLGISKKNILVFKYLTTGYR